MAGSFDRGLAHRWLRVKGDGARRLTSGVFDSRAARSLFRLAAPWFDASIGSIFEREQGALFLWLPVAIAAGCGAYYSLAVEPGHVALLLVGACAAAALAAALRRRDAAVPWLVLALTGGFLLAKIHTDQVAAPSLPYTVGPVRISGIVERVSPGRGGTTKVVLLVESLPQVEERVRPRRIGLTLTPASRLKPGDRVAGLVRLSPLPSLVAPRAFDFARMRWLEGIGATARPVGVLSASSPRQASLVERARGLVDDLRRDMASRIRSVIPGDIGELAVALVTGERASIPERMSESLQTSGLAHIVSISGLHMSLVAGGMFWALRAALALSASLALGWPIKKWAALAALATGGFYLVISGNEVATQRSYIMLAVMFSAMLADRPALSLRNVALAALLILVIQPAAVLNAGFQMSFLAVTGLLSFFAARRNRPKPLPPRRQSLWPLFVLRMGLGWLGVMAATTLIASLCTGPVAAFHFNRVSPYSLLANLLALPIVSAIVMPGAMAGTLLMPVGLEAWPLKAMAWGLDGVMRVSDWTSGLPGSRLFMPSQATLPAVLTSFGILWICLFRTGLRWHGVAICLLSLAVSATGVRPDVIIERTAINVAVRNDRGELSLIDDRQAGFATERWLAADGDGASPAEAAHRSGWTCTDVMCSASVKGKSVAYARRSAELALVCPVADVLIAAFPLRGRCRSISVRIDRFDVWRHGAYALYFEGGEIRIETANALRGNRPWTVKAEPRPKPVEVTQ